MAYVWVLTWGWGHCREYEDTPQNMVEAASRLKTFTLVPAVGKPSPPIPLHFTPRLQICFINSAISPKNRQGHHGAGLGIAWDQVWIRCLEGEAPRVRAWHPLILCSPQA